MSPIADDVERRASTISDWLLRGQKDGMRSRYNEKRPGRECKLSDKQIDQLSKDVQENPKLHGFEKSFWTSKMVTVHIQRKFGITYVRHSV